MRPMPTERAGAGWHALILWSPEGSVDGDVAALRLAASDLGSPRVSIDVSRDRYEMPGGWAKRIVVHVQARSGEEARAGMRARIPDRKGYGGVEIWIEG